MTNTSANHYHRSRLDGKILQPCALFSRMRRLTEGTPLITLRPPGSRTTLLSPRPLRTVRAALAAHGSGKLYRFQGSIIVDSSDAVVDDSIGVSVSDFRVRRYHRPYVL